MPVAVQGTNFVDPTTFTGNIFTQNINQFTTGTVFVFADSQVPTSVSSPTFLTATVPSSLLVTTGTVQVRVRNLGPSGDFVDSAPFSFIVGSAPPQLTSVTGVPSPLIAGKVTNPFQVTVNGSGFTPATRVRVNFIDRPTTFVNQNQVIGTVLPGDLTIPGFVPITVQNPNTVDSTPFQMPLLYPIPVLAQISPNLLTAQLELNAQPILVTLYGNRFQPESDQSAGHGCCAGERYGDTDAVHFHHSTDGVDSTESHGRRPAFCRYRWRIQPRTWQHRMPSRCS